MTVTSISICLQSKPCLQFSTCMHVYMLSIHMSLSLACHSKYNVWSVWQYLHNIQEIAVYPEPLCLLALAYALPVCRRMTNT